MGKYCMVKISVAAIIFHYFFTTELYTGIWSFRMSVYVPCRHSACFRQADAFSSTACTQRLPPLKLRPYGAIQICLLLLWVQALASATPGVRQAAVRSWTYIGGRQTCQSNAAVVDFRHNKWCGERWQRSNRKWATVTNQWDSAVRSTVIMINACIKVDCFTWWLGAIVFALPRSNSRSHCVCIYIRTTKFRKKQMR